MKLILVFLVAASFTACTPKSADEEATPAPGAATPVPAPAVYVPPATPPGAWMWQSKDGKTPRPALNISDDPFNQKPHR